MIVTPDSAASIPELYDKAQAAFDQRKYTEAAQQFDRVAKLDPRGPLAPSALFRAGVSHDLAGAAKINRTTALARFESVARRYPQHALARPALVRALRMLMFLERWERAAAVAQRLLDSHARLRPLESILVKAALVLSCLQRGREQDAESWLDQARTEIERHGLDAAGTIPRDLATLHYGEGELRRRKAERINFDPLPKDFPAALERRAELLLQAQAAYSNTMRAHDAHWSAMAGYQVGRLYEDLHRDLMAIRPPSTADTSRRRQLFEGALRLRYSVLLNKALTMIEHTLAMAQRTGERSEWVDRATESKLRLEQARQRENEAIDRLPYTRAQLMEALEQLGQRGKAQHSGE
jgi:hypothetical protein